MQESKKPEEKETITTDTKAEVEGKKTDAVTDTKKPVDPKDKNKKGLKLAAMILIPVLIIILLFTVFTQNKDGNNGDKDKNNSSYSFSAVDYNTKASLSSVEDEKLSQQLNAELQKKRASRGIEYNWYMGLVNVSSLKELKVPVPKIRTTEGAAEIPKDKLLDDIIPFKKNSCDGKTSMIYYPDYKIEAPMVYGAIEDMFKKDKEGYIDFSDQKADDYGAEGEKATEDKLREGVLHLGISPMPGDLGNSYLSGHSSNDVDQKFPEGEGTNKYNKIFKPIEKTSKVGETFFICDYKGRKLQFKVFKVEDIVNNSDLALINYTDKRVVTLQASIRTPEDIANRTFPSRRWLTRAELMVDESKKLNQ